MVTQHVIKDEDVSDYLITQIKNKYKNIITLYADQHPLRLNYVASLQLVEKKGKPDMYQQGQQSVSSEWVFFDHHNLFKGNHSSMELGKRILIVGEVGTGKSTLCAVITESWASGKLFQEFLIVLLLPLNRKDVISVKDLPELIKNVCKFDDDICLTIGIYLKQNKKDNVLIIADGWNELCESKSQDTTFLFHLLFGDILPRSTLTVVVTSRPGSVPQQFNGRLVTLQGFNEKAIRSYIQMECSSKQERLHRTIKEFESNPLMGSMCTVPLNLAMICNFCKSHDDPLPSTLPEIYERLAWNLIQLNINSTKKRGRALMLMNYQDLPKELQHPWSHLCGTAFEKCRANSIQAAFALSSNVETFGVLKPEFSGRDEVMFSFLHPAIGYYLAVSHLIAMPQSTQLEAIKGMHQVDPMFCRFYLSMNKDANHNIVKEVVQKLSKMHHSCNMCILSYESRNRIVNQEVVESLHTPGTTLKLHSHNAYECEAMIHVLEKIQHRCTVEINFHNSKLKSAQVSRLANILQSRLIQVKGLDLSNNNLDDSIMIFFFRRMVSALGSLEKLFLRSCGITSEGFGVIVNTLTSKSLIELDLSFNSLSVDCLGYLLQYIASDNMKKMEILILKGSFAESVSISFLKIFATTLSLKCNYLRRLDLSANDLGAHDNPDLDAIIDQLTTRFGKSFDLRLDDRYMSKVESNFLSIMEESIRNKGTIDHIIAHGVIVGPGRSGKNSLMRRLMGERPLAPNQISPSTGVLENITVGVKKLSTVTSENCDLIWQKLEYDEEALELIMTIAKSYTHIAEIPKPSSIKYVYKRKAKSENATLEEMVPKEPESMNSDENNETPSMHISVYSSSLAPVDILKKAVKLRRMDALREHLESSWSLYLTNMGGQIEFQEHLPLLVRGSSIFFVTFPLHHDLDQPYEVQYQYPDGSVKRYPSPSTLIDEILQTLATICTLDCVNVQVSGEEVTSKPTVFLIGTHKDCLKPIDKQQKIKEIDKKLRRCVKHTSLFRQHSLQFASYFEGSRDNRLMFTVSNLSANDDDFKKIRFAVQQTVERNYYREFTVQCPSSWLIFSLVLRERHKSNRVLRLENAFKIAQECGISSHDELIAALSFIHSRLGLLRYYNVEGLDSLVIVDPQVLFDKITDLLEETFVSKHAHRKEIEDFCEKGIISVAVIKRISERSSEDVQLPLTWLTKVLNHLRLAALFKDHDEEKYFFPSALCHAATAQDSSVKSAVHTNLASALIAFEIGFCPRGTAGALIKCLMTNEMKSTKRWELLPSKIFRNQVSFFIEDCGAMTIKVLPTHIEFAIDSDEITKIDCCESEIHEEVYTQITKCMKIVTNLYCNKKYQFYWTFYCTLAECQPHPHPAVIEWRHNGPLKLRCQVFYMSTALPRGYKLWNILKKGNILTESNIRILNLVLSEHLTNLEKSGLSLNQGERITEGEVVMHLKNIDQHKLAEIFSEDNGIQLLQDHIHDNVYKKALQDSEHIVNLQVFRMVLCGVPRSGKTTFWKRIAMKDFKPSPESASTGAAESHIISAIGRKSDQAHVPTEREKQESDQAHVHTEMLFDLHLYSKDSDLDREALTIYRLILERHRPQPQPETCIDKSYVGRYESQTERHRQTETYKPEDGPQASEIVIQDSEMQEDLKADSLKPTTDNEDTPSGNIRRDLSAQDDITSAALPTSTVSKKQSHDPITTEIRKQFKKLNQLLLMGKSSSDLPSIKKMCHLQDTGGQRAFLELLPTLSTGKALYLLFFNYENFEKVNSETRQAEGSPKELPTGIEYKQIDVIMQSLICVSTASEAIQSTDESQSTNNVALLVGTHIDNSEVTSETVARVDGIIYERVRPFCEKGRLMYAHSGGKEWKKKEKKQYLALKVAIDETKIKLCSNNPKDYVNVIMDIVDNKLKCKESEELPASWYMFCIMLRRLQNAGYSVLRYSHCRYIAEKLYIPQSELKSLLFRLQNVFGIVLYFPEVEALEDIVVCDPAFVYKSISKFIFGSFCGRCDVSSLNKLQKHGIFQYKELKEHIEKKEKKELEEKELKKEMEKKENHCEIKEYLKLSKLIILLKHLGIIAPIKRSNTAQIAESESKDDSDNEDIHPDQEYVIPCVLEEAEQHELINVQLKNTHACSIIPLRIYFDCGFAPMGGFCYLFTKLISNNKGWELCIPDKWEDENHIYWRNKVTLKIKHDSRIYFMTLLSTDIYYEIHIIHSMSKLPFKLQNDGHSICEHVWKAIHTILKESPNKPLQAYRVACICTIETNHVMEFECKPHENSSEVKAYCKECKCPALLDIQPSIMVWFKAPCIQEQGEIGGKVHLCNLLFKHNKKSPKYELQRDGKRIINLEANEHYSVEYESDSEMYIFSISHFKPDLEGTYKCVVSTTGKNPVSTAVEVITHSRSPLSLAVHDSNFNTQLQEEYGSEMNVGCTDAESTSKSTKRAHTGDGAVSKAKQQKYPQPQERHHDEKSTSKRALTDNCTVTAPTAKRPKESDSPPPTKEIDGGGGSTHGSSGAAHASATNTTSDSPPTLATMFEILLPESSQWKNIGVMLSLDHGRLTAIEDQYRGVPNNCLREMLIEWLQQTNPQPTKSALIKAVKIFNSSLAETISTL